MLDFLRLMTPRHSDALRPASPLRRATSMAVEGEGFGDAPIFPDMASPMPGEGPQAQASTPWPSTPAATSSIVDEASSAATKPSPRIVSALPNEGTAVSPSAATIRPLPADSAPLSSLHAAPPAVLSPPLATPGHPAPAFAPIPTVAPSRPTVSAFVAEMDRPLMDRPLSATALARFTPNLEKAPPPAIHVSIDRIEVRAPSPPAKAAANRTRPATSIPSLADYLRGRGSAP